MRNIDTYAGALLAVVALGSLILWLLALCRSAARPRPPLPRSVGQEQRDPGLGVVWHRRYETTVAYDQPVARITDEEFHEWVKGWKP